MDVDLAPLVNLLPWLAGLSAPMGLAMRWIRTNTAVAGFGLLGVAALVAAATVGAMGLALGWDAAQWKGAPLGILVLVAGSVLADTTASHAADTIQKRNGG